MDRRRQQANSSHTYCQSVVKLYPDQLGGHMLPPIAAWMNVIGRVSATNSAKWVRAQQRRSSGAAVVCVHLHNALHWDECALSFGWS